MLRYLYGTQLADYPRLADTMFRDRADQFSGRLGWDVTVDENGHERDQYDVLNPLYVIWELPDGTHGGSMRLLPTTGRTMVNEHFLDALDGVRVESPLIWECTRFCISPRADRRATAALFLAGCELIEHFSIEAMLGVFDPRMVRVYKIYGYVPEIIGTQGEGKDQICVGLLPLREGDLERTLGHVGISRETSLDWFNRSFRIPTATAPELSVKSA